MGILVRGVLVLLELLVLGAGLGVVVGGVGGVGGCVVIVWLVSIRRGVWVLV